MVFKQTTVSVPPLHQVFIWGPNTITNIQLIQNLTCLDFIYVLSNYLLSTYYVPGPVLRVGDTENIIDKNLCPSGDYVLTQGVTHIKQISKYIPQKLCGMEENKTERGMAEPRVSAKASKASLSLFPSMPLTIILLILPLSDSTTPVQQLVLFIICHYL